MTDALKNVTVYLNEERLKRIDAIQQELSRKVGVPVSRSAAIGRAIDDLFLVVCPIDRTNDQSVCETVNA